MNKNALRWLYQELPGLVSKGILSQETSDNLKNYYGEIKSTSKNWLMLIIFGILGAILIGLGIILLIGHNWEELSRSTRCVLSLAPLIIAQGFAGWVLLKRPDSSALKEGSAIFLSLMIGASIALISQTYNIPSDTGLFVITWMLLILPIVYLMQASIPAAIYVVGVTSWAGSYWNDPTKSLLFWVLAALIIPHFIWVMHKKTYTLRATILSFVLALCVLSGASFSLGKTWPDSWIIILSSVYSVLFSLGSVEFKGITSNWQRPMRFIGAIAIIILAFMFTFKYLWTDVYSSYHVLKRDFYSMSALPDHIISFSIVSFAILLWHDFAKRKDLINALYAVLPIFAIIGYFLRNQSLFLLLFIFNLYLFVLSISHIIIGVRSNRLGSLNIGMLILAALIISRFFDSDIDFIVKGFVFIVVGIGFLVSNIMLIRRKGGAR